MKKLQPLDVVSVRVFFDSPEDRKIGYLNAMKVLNDKGYIAEGERNAFAALLVEVAHAVNADAGNDIFFKLINFIIDRHDARDLQAQA